MQLSLDRNASQYTIDRFDGTALWIKETAYTESLLISPHTLIPYWPVTSIAELDLAALEPLLALKPEIVLLGTGKTNVFPPPSVSYFFLSRHIGFEAMSTAAAMRTYAVLSSEDRKVAAALIL